MDPAVSIVIPVYNRDKLICRCLDSVWAQTYRPLHVFVVDNNSSDGTPEAVRRWCRDHGVCDNEGEFRLHLLSELKAGASAARNRGLSEVDTEHVLFFDSDDEMLPTLVSDARHVIGEKDLVYWQAELVGLDGRVKRKPYHVDDLVRRQFYNSMLATQVYMARTAFIREIGGWEERALVWNDWELGVRIALAAPRCVALPKVLVRIYAQEKSITGSMFSRRVGDWEATLAIVSDKIERRATDGGKGNVDIARLRSMISYRQMILAAQYRREGATKEARELMSRAIAGPTMPSGRRFLLRLLYRYTFLGGRGAYYLWTR